MNINAFATVGGNRKIKWPKSYSHFDVGVGEPVDVHSCQVGAALHAHAETPAAPDLASVYVFVLRVERRQKLQGEEETSPLLQAVELLVLPLRGTKQVSGELEPEGVGGGPHRVERGHKRERSIRGFLP